jgi:hypothetical protein
VALTLLWEPPPSIPVLVMFLLFIPILDEC